MTQDCKSRNAFDEWCIGLEDIDNVAQPEQSQEEQLDLFEDVEKNSN
jgi:hypothetical protein